MENFNLINKEAWNAYQSDYMKFHLMERPDFFEFYMNGGVDLDAFLPSMLGEVKGLKLLDTCCACDAKQAFSWHNLGAIVTACDISDEAIKIATKNAIQMNFDIDFVVADMQKLEPIGGSLYDVVFATYPVWVQNIDEACKTWHRVLKSGGRLLWHTSHPIVDCIEERESGLHIIQDYNASYTAMYDKFAGTPMAERQAGGWSVDLPVAEHFWRISDLLNAVCGAGFTLLKVHESYEERNAHKHTGREMIEAEPEMRKLPCEFTILAVK